ncbi:acylglycerol lipase [Acrasis kona]|uniref:Acylglycerol lipase n=1 Tax=Acrasis kona TaxID=1008807 RepID=A0AAW2YTD4_9EUKA
MKAEQVLTVEGCEIYTRIFEPEAVPCGSIIIITGICESLKMYKNLAKKFSKEGFRVLCYDQRGFGKSGGKRGVLDSEETFYSDLSAVIKSSNITQISGEPELPFFIFAHGTGAIGAVQYIQRPEARKVDGLILSAPSFHKFKDHSELEKGAMNLISKIDPNHLVTYKIEINARTTDTKFRKMLNELSNEVSIKQLKIWEDVGNVALYHSKSFKHPVFILHGNQDVVTDHQSTLSFFETISSNDKKCVIADGFKHNLHLDENRQKIIEDILKWVYTRAVNIKREQDKSMRLTVGPSVGGGRKRSAHVSVRPAALEVMVQSITLNGQ